MALGIKRETEIYTILSIPLEWEDNLILANHFRMMADELLTHSIKVLSARLFTPINQMDKPALELVCLIDHYK